MSYVYTVIHYAAALYNYTVTMNESMK